MKVAVAGTGNLAQYLFEEFRKHGHELVVLTRSSKTGRDYEQRETDYNITSLVTVLYDCDALVSTISDFTNPAAATKIHLDMLQACKQTRKCKTFIPSEWTCNVEDYPDQPIFLAEANKTMHSALEAEKDLRTTIICNSWFADYVVPKERRHLRDVGALWPMDHARKVITIYGPGTHTFDVVSSRDVAKAVATLLDSTEPWDPYTYLSGDEISLNDLFAIMKENDPAWTSENKSLATTIQPLLDQDSPPDSIALAFFELLIYSGASKLPRDKVFRQRAKFFPDLKFRSVKDLLTAAAVNSDQIV